MQSRSRLKMLVALVALIGAPLPAIAGGITTNTFYAIEDSSEAVLWSVGDTLATGEGLHTDIDTSIVYDAQYWEAMSMQAKFRPFTDWDTTGSADSGAASIYFQMSNDQLYWVTLDSLIAVDSLAAFKVFTMRPYRYARLVVRDGTKTDSAGVRGSVVINTVGRW